MCTNSLEEEQRRALKAFLDRNNVFALLPTEISKKFAPLVVLSYC